MKTIYEKDMPLLSRKRIAYEIEHLKKATPKKADIQEEISKKLKVDKNLVKIKHIYSKFGVSKSKIITHVYSDSKTKQLLEDKKEKTRKKKKKAKK